MAVSETVVPRKIVIAPTRMIGSGPFSSRVVSQAKTPSQYRPTPTCSRRIPAWLRLSSRGNATASGITATAATSTKLTP